MPDDGSGWVGGWFNPPSGCTPSEAARIEAARYAEPQQAEPYTIEEGLSNDALYALECLRDLGGEASIYEFVPLALAELERAGLVEWFDEGQTEGVCLTKSGKDSR